MGQPPFVDRIEVNKDSKTELWNFEMLPPSYLIPAGWTRSSKVWRQKRSPPTASSTAPGRNLCFRHASDGKTLTMRAADSKSGTGAVTSAPFSRSWSRYLEA